MVHPTFRVMRQSRKTYSLSLKYSSSLKLYALRFMTLILLFIPSTLPVDIWQSYHASIPLLYASIPLLYIQGCKAPMHDIENCCSLLYICLWLFKYTKCSAVFFRSIQTLSLHFPDEPLLFLAYIRAHERMQAHTRCRKNRPLDHQYRLTDRDTMA